MMIIFTCLLGTLWLLIKVVVGVGCIYVLGMVGLCILLDHRCNSVPESWLTKMSFEVPPDAEAEGLGKFGRTKLMPGDQVWLYSSPLETWRRMCGRMGFALVRKGRIIETDLWVMN